MALSYASIDRQFAPLSRALLRDGKLEASAVIEGFTVRATRRPNLHVRYGGCGGPAWFPHYTVTGEGIGYQGRGSTSGERCHMVEAIRHAAIAKARGQA
jgi:hypothetical protein